MAKRSDKKEQKLSVIEFIEEYRDLVGEDLLSHCRTDSYLEAFQDPYIKQVIQLAKMSCSAEEIGFNILLGYIIEQWDRHRTIYKFTDSIMEDLLDTPYPSIPLSSLNLPFRTYCLDLSDLEFYDLQGDRISAAIIHYETDDSPEAIEAAMAADEVIQKALEEGNDPSKYKDQLKYLYGKCSDPFERITMCFLKKVGDTWSHYTHFEVVRDHMHLPIKDMPEMETLSDKNMSRLVKAAIYSMVYLSTEEPDIQESEITRKAYHRVSKLKNTSVRQMDVGMVYLTEKKRAAVSRQQHLENNTALGLGTPKRPHWRRGHFHTYWIGKGRYKISIKWLSPIHVNESEDNIPVTIRLQK